jgi:S-formylglutathione hydrolase FrmB
VTHIRRPRPETRALLPALAVLLLAAASVGASPAELRDGHGIHVETTRQLDSRQLDVRVSTSALQRPVDVRVLLPDDYDTAPHRHYPVLYLFHGTSGRASDWVNFGRAVETTAGLPLIVVMPDAGFDGDGGGWFADWFNGGAGGPPMWETFHIEQLVPWIDANLRTVATRAGRAVAGLSQGGFGALSYAARHPDRFTSVASFSGGCVIDGDPEAIATATTIIQYTTTVLSGVDDPDAIFGPRDTQELNWQSHDPGTLVTNLRGMQVELWTGDGNPGPLDPGRVDPAASSIEVITFGATQRFDRYLTAAGIPHGYFYYGAGTHTFGYWARDLEEYVGPLMRRFRRRAPRPRAIGFLSTDDRWQRWGWQVEQRPPEPAFVQLSRARKSGFVITGAGRSTVRTAAFYRPGTRVRVTKRSGAAVSAREMTVGSSGRLRVPVVLSTDAAPGTTRVAIRQVGPP